MPASRPRRTPAVYRRRRLAALLAAAAVLLAVVALLDAGDPTGDPTSEGSATGRGGLFAEPPPEPVELTISVSGDILVHSPVWARALELGGGEYDFAPMFAELGPYVKRADLAFCHVETPMTPAPPQSYPIFNTPPALAEGVAENGWDACSIASNHSLDQGLEGIVGTGEALDRADVEHTGAFASARARRQPLLVEAEGVRVAYLSYTTDTNGIPSPEPWAVNLTDDPGPILADARAARKEGAEAVIVNLHWGSEIVPEYQAEPSSGQVALARALLRSEDVTAVVGQGPHAVQPVERLGDKYVVFSEGNLVSNQSAAAGLPAQSQDGLVALLDLVVRGDRARVDGVRYVPVFVSQPDYTVLPVGDALEAGQLDPATAQASYERTVGVVGRGEGVQPVPARLPG